MRPSLFRSSRATRHFLCGAACYPEGHPEAASREADLDNLKRKVDAGVDFLISQLFFDNADFLAFRERAERAGIRVPILAESCRSLASANPRIHGNVRAKIPKDLLQKVEAVENDVEACPPSWHVHATQQCIDLPPRRIAGIHFYTLNSLDCDECDCQMIKASM